MFVIVVNLFGNCNDFVVSMSVFVNIMIILSSEVVVGELMVVGNDIFVYCLVIGSMFECVSDIDGNVYVICFEMCLFFNWNGCFYY